MIRLDWVSAFYSRAVEVDDGEGAKPAVKTVERDEKPTERSASQGLFNPDRKWICSEENRPARGGFQIDKWPRS